MYQKHYKQIIFLAVCLMILLFALYRPQINAVSSSNPLEVAVLKVGKADAIIVEQGGEYMVIDAGEEDDGYEIVNYLQSQGVKELKKLIITHFDKDHVGGADTLIENIPVQEILVPDYVGVGSDYLNFVQTLETLQINPVYMKEDVEFTLGECNVRVEAPKSYDIHNGNNEVDNDLSLITIIEHGENRLVFMGDAEKHRIREWMATDSAVPCDFLKFPHHGVYTTEHENLIEVLKPEFVAICSSTKNPADVQTVQLLKSSGARVAETKDGDIYVVSDGKKIHMSQKGVQQ